MKLVRFAWAPLLALAAALASPARADEWEETIDRVARAVVALRVSGVRSFDTESPATSLATGFVVDAERGLILTNRHVVQPGPVKAHAIFLNHEEVEVVPVYRDPVHDFGFYRYDPKELRFMQPVALPLAPEAARVGVELRVIGNDAGEKLSILAGTLARLDRDAPNYGRGEYNDFNTFYYQAASSSSGGSSGSPVVDRRGRVIALNAGGSLGSASSFFLPLDRPTEALRAIQAGQPVARGTLQAVFLQKPYYDLARLGLRQDTEARVRRAQPGSVGMLVVSEVVPGGPADGLLQPGDIAVTLDGKLIDGFVSLEDVLDARVGEKVSLEIERGGEPLTLQVPVGDMHAITPASFLEFGGGVLNPLSFQLARSFALPVRGVFLAATGYAFGRAGIPAGVLIEALDGVPVRTLADFEREVAARPDGSLVRVRYEELGDKGNPRVAPLRVDRRWFPMQRCDRAADGGSWECRESPAPPPAPPPTPVTLSLPEERADPMARVAHSLVQVRFDVALPVDGVQGGQFTGAGLVVDAARGLVLTDRDTVPILLGDADIVVGGSAILPAHVVALHPEHNLALVQYDPRQLAGAPLVSAELDPRELAPGDDIWLVAMTSRQQLLSRATQVERVDAPVIPIPDTPRFRETNVDLVSVSDELASVGGVLTDKRGRVRALWASFSTDAGGKASSFFAGIPAAVLRDWLDAADRPWRALGAELEALPVFRARERGLPPAVAEQLERGSGASRRVFAVRGVTAGTPAAQQLQVGDLLVRLDGRPLTQLLDLERAVQRGAVDLELVRDEALAQARLETLPALAPATDRLLLWGGALLQPVPASLTLQRGLPRTGVYVAGRWRGTPAEAHELAPTWRILAVDGVQIPDLDAFLAAVRGKPDGSSLRLFVVDLEGRERLLTLELDLAYWPTVELLRGADGQWRRTPVQP